MTIKSLENLNAPQLKAVSYLDGPLLVLAGAGSGKTRVLTRKIAYLLEAQRMSPYAVLAVTFTNKAASEMKSRVEKVIDIPIDGLWIGTFHSICARIMRIEGHLLGYDRNFTIYDTDDQLKLIQQVMAGMNIDQQLLKPRQAQYRISDAKNRMVSAAQFEKLAADPLSRKIAQIFYEYQNQLRRNNACDFDDLLIKPLDIFTKYGEVLQKYQQRFQYLLVDEYQDTNKAQYYLIKMLSEKHRKICVVGDEDQSIYRWRGADIENILGFERDYPECEVIRLEQNYRSTQTIVEAANAVVQRNKKRLGKQLWSDRDGGEKVQIHETFDAADEAGKAVAILKSASYDHNYSYNDIAILYRTNAQSRALEDKLRRANIGYTIVGGTKFYERKEVKDVLAYLRVLINPRDAVALRRIINVPTRGIGNVTQQRIEQFGAENNLSFYEALSQTAKIEQLSTAVRNKVRVFYEALEELRGNIDSVSAFDLASAVVDRFGLDAAYTKSATPEDAVRLENITELLNSIALFSEEHEDPEDGSLAKYLEEVSLLTDVDRWDPDKPTVTLMTLHSAKGLEFPVVILSGMEDGLFPLFRSLEDDDDLEEERRLFYVGMTRAMDRLYLLWARQRRRFTGEGSGASFRNTASRFLVEIPNHLCQRNRISGYSASMDRSGGFADRKVRRSSPKSNFPAAVNFDDSGTIFKIGTWVVHDDFGKGQVLGVEKSNAGIKLTVIFANRQIKKLIAEYANLTIVTD